MSENSLKLTIESKRQILNEFENKFRQISVRNKQMKRILESNQWSSTLLNYHLNRPELVIRFGKNLRYVKTIESNSPFRFSGTNADNKVEDFLKQMIEMIDKRIEIYRQRLPINRQLYELLRRLRINGINSPTVEEFIGSGVGSTKSSDVRPMAKPICDCSSETKCIAFCQKSNSFAVDDTKYCHFALYSSLHALAIAYYENGRPITAKVKHIVIPDGTYMSIKAQYITSNSNQLFAARIAIFSQYVSALDSNHKSKRNVRELVFHAMVELSDIIPNSSTIASKQVNLSEHSDKTRCSPRRQVMDKISDYLSKFKIIFDDYEFDLKALITAGLELDFESKHKNLFFYDIKKFYKIYNPMNRKSEALTLQWLNQNLLHNKSESSAVADAENTLSLFMIATRVMAFDTIGQKHRPLVVSEYQESIVRLTLNEIKECQNCFNISILKNLILDKYRNNRQNRFDRLVDEDIAQCLSGSDDEIDYDFIADN